MPTKTARPPQTDSHAATAVLPPQGLAGGPDPNNNLSVVLQLQAEF
jgi:hypothetical protein